ncbi:ribokinase [Polaromonas sp. JS666]|uniref:ribokinase n=1 Tax=Polaromonas sp. (strain JS666 / ATCC BAA-500) TaxID=296591 RepID=UPI0008862F5E|nr:ribokinase [Polaromonas sp. JS666]SDM53376.1 ribokinase [Polaromonas sp. JS666]
MNADVVCVASWNADLISKVARPIARGETLMASDFSISPGGKGSNAAVAAARQGARVALLARIGEDDFGRMGMALWHAEGIDTSHVEQVAGERSGVAQILVYEDGDNSIAVYPGAGSGLGARHAQAAATLLAGCRVVMASCEVPAEAALQAFALARAAGALTVLNPAPARPLGDEMLALVDVLTPNESELLLLAGQAHAGSTDQAAARLLERGARAVLVTLGAAGCRLYQAGQAPQSIPGRTMAVRDTIGAGDTFTGALAATLARGEALPAAMQWANAAAALSVTRHGAIDGIPRLADVAALLG